jgi:hypothetical protein
VVIFGMFIDWIGILFILIPIPAVDAVFARPHVAIAMQKRNPGYSAPSLNADVAMLMLIKTGKD